MVLKWIGYMGMRVSNTIWYVGMLLCECEMRLGVKDRSCADVKYDLVWGCAHVVASETIWYEGALMWWRQKRFGMRVRSCAGVKYEGGTLCACALASNTFSYTTTIILRSLSMFLFSKSSLNHDPNLH